MPVPDIAAVRAALDAALREAQARRGHIWGGLNECNAHNDHCDCCLDPEHPNYSRMLDDLSARIAKKLTSDG